MAHDRGYQIYEVIAEKFLMVNISPLSGLLCLKVLVIRSFSIQPVLPASRRI